jgi:hypothetical protein
MDIQVIADEIHADGYLVARLSAAGVPSTVLGEFEHLLQGATLGEQPEACDGDSDTSESVDFAIDGALDELLKRANAFAKGGLLTLGELGKLVQQLKDKE